jgi:hypothetical protein
MSKITALHTFQDGSRLVSGDFFLIRKQNQNVRSIGCCGVFHISRSGRVLNRFDDSDLDGFSFKLFKILPDDRIILIFASDLNCAEYFFGSLRLCHKKNIFKIMQHLLLDRDVSEPKSLD